MKTKAWMILSVFSLFCCTGSMTSLASPDVDTPNREISLQTTPALKSLAEGWIHRYNSIQNEFHASLAEAGSLLLNSQSSAEEYAWETIVGRNPILFLNPAGQEELQTGLSRSTLKKLLNDQTKSLSIYLTDHAGVIAALKQFSGRNPEEIPGIQILSGEEIQKIISSRENSLCIVPCSLLPAPAVVFTEAKIIKIDLNDDGVIDPVEDIYEDMNTFMRGVWIGKYPKNLSLNLVLLSKNPTLNEGEEAFVRYILTAGQSALTSQEFAPLSYTEQISNLARIPGKPAIMPLKVKNASNLATLLAAGALFILLVLVWYLSKWKRIAHRVKKPNHYQPVPLVHEHIKIPGGVLFDHAHTWTFMEQDGAIKLGIDDFLQHITGPITRINIETERETIKKGEVIAVIAQNGKKIEVLSPISGKIKGYNVALQNTPALINQSPFDQGWICRIEPSNWAVENQSLIIPSEYSSWLLSEFVRFKDFLQQAFNRQKVKVAPIALNDGGEILDEILSQFGPETWEDFGENFMKPSKLN